MGDNAELQALFEQASAQAQTVTAAAQKSAAVAPVEDDLESLFDQVSSQAWSAPAEVAAVAAASATDPAAAVDAATPEAAPDVFHRVGQLTRTLHDALRELGFDKGVESSLQALPDTRDRLAYIATLTGKAADRALAAVEAGKVHQDRLQDGAQKLGAQWDRVYSGEAGVEEFKATAGATREFLKGLPAETGATNAQLTEIMMAQDFHDLTGQVINRVVTLAREMEQHLLALLLETTPPDRRPNGDEGFLNGPVINAAGRADVVTGQAQVDDLLESLGF